MNQAIKDRAAELYESGMLMNEAAYIKIAEEWYTKGKEESKARIKELEQEREDFDKWLCENVVVSPAMLEGYKKPTNENKQ